MIELYFLQPYGSRIKLGRKLIGHKYPLCRCISLGQILKADLIMQRLAGRYELFDTETPWPDLFVRVDCRGTADLWHQSLFIGSCRGRSASCIAAGDLESEIQWWMDLPAHARAFRDQASH
jgi:hypothetical protein